MKKIMILGAGIYQVPLILKAKEMGLYTLVVSYPGPYPGFALADECLYLDTRDEAGILKAAREKRDPGHLHHRNRCCHPHARTYSRASSSSRTLSGSRRTCDR